jgi:hypothetical protein
MEVRVIMEALARPAFAGPGEARKREPDTELMFVQFPHAGPEQRSGGPGIAWSPMRDPLGQPVSHARKFLRAHGSYLSDLSGTPVSGPVAFWGEWEPQSRVIYDYLQSDRGCGLPCRLLDPYWQRPRVAFPRHNTDPLVFGEHFVYSNCRQENNGRLRRLAEGSVILFGSKQTDEIEFVLDTVMVIGEGIRDYVISYSGDMPDGSDLVQGVVFEPLRSGLSGPGDEPGFRLYRGRSYQEAPGGPFSFVPCLPAADPAECAFARPVIRLRRPWLNPSQWRGATCTSATSDQLRELWDEVVRQVVGAGLALGVGLDEPEKVAGEAEGSPVVGTAGDARQAGCAAGSKRPRAAGRC